MNERNAKAVIEIFNIIYGLLYDGKIKPAPGTMAKGDAWIADEDNHEMLGALVGARPFQDPFISDREVTALALALGL